jgi:hypothetical protein
MGIAIIGTDTRSGQVMGDPTRPPHRKDTNTRSGQVMGDPARPDQVMMDPTRPPHMNDTSHGQVMGDPTRVAKRTDGRSVEETLISMIPGVGWLFQLFSSPHMDDPIRRAFRHLKKRDTRPPHTNDTTSAQVRRDPSRTPHMNDTSHSQ